MRRKLVFLLVVLMVFTVYSFGEKIELKIPLRVKDKSLKEFELKKSDIVFTVNKKIVSSFELKKEQRSITGDGLPLKYFVLDFNIFDYYEDIGNSVDYFIDNFVKGQPIILLTRNKIYKFFNYNSASYLKKTIKKLLREDTIKFKAETKSYYKKFKSIFSSADLGTKEGCQKFINDYLREWSVYKTRFVYPDIRKYQMLANILSNKDGDKFIISFYHREIIPYYNEVQKALSDMNNFISSAVEGEDQAWSTMISGGINDINQSLLISKSFPYKNLINTLLSNNINMNLILLNNKMNNKDVEGYNDVSPDMEKVLRDIAISTGGISITTDDLKNGINKITENEDRYYYLKFYTKKAKDLIFEVKAVNKKIEFIYPTEYKKNFIKNFVKLLKKKPVVSGVDVSSKRIGFSISNYLMNKRGKNGGVLKVNIIVKDNRGVIAYKTGNILNVIKKSINIKLPPVNLSGKYNLFIVVRDLLGESSTIFVKEVFF